MFDHLLVGIKRDLDNVRSIVETHERLRDLILSSLAPDALHVEADLRAIARIAPAKSDWLLYDHCAAVTRLYAIFENFIENLVTEYLGFLPSLYPIYDELPQKIRTQHRIGIAQILQKIGKEGLYKEISEAKVIEGLAAGLFSNGYSLYGKAFLVDPQNYRAEMVRQIFGYLDFVDIWAGVEKHPEVINFMTSRDANETPRTLLKKLVEDRNIASHTSSSSTWSIGEMKAIAFFLEAVTIALCQIALKAIVSRQGKTEKIEQVGTVIHKFKANVVGLKCAGAPISIGDLLIVSQTHGAFTAKINSIQLGPTPHSSIVPSVGQELGLGLDCAAALKAELFRVTTVQSNLLAVPDAGEILSPDDDYKFEIEDPDT
jgi:hypothetical protein